MQRIDGQGMDRTRTATTAAAGLGANGAFAAQSRHGVHRTPRVPRARLAPRRTLHVLGRVFVRRAFHLRPRRRLVRAVLALLVVGAAEAEAADHGLSFVGGPDGSGQNYAWTLTNGSRATVTEVRIPHYRAAVFTAPPGWKTDESTYLVNVGVADRAGECVAKASTVGEGIRPGRSGEFRLQLTASGAARGTGRVIVGLDDGSRVEVAGVPLPVAESVGDKYVTFLGLVAIFGSMVLIQRLRRPRRRPVSETNDAS